MASAMAWRGSAANLLPLKAVAKQPSFPGNSSVPIRRVESGSSSSCPDFLTPPTIAIAGHRWTNLGRYTKPTGGGCLPAPHITGDAR